MASPKKQKTHTRLHPSVRDMKPAKDAKGGVNVPAINDAPGFTVAPSDPSCKTLKRP